MSYREDGAARPGVKKARHALVAIQTSTRVRTEDAEWRALFDAADAVSEGSVRHEAGGDVWYGSTSLILALPEALSAERSAFTAAVAAADPHVRVRAIRFAHREAASRAQRGLGRSTCEVRISYVERGLRIDVDVQAPLIEGKNLGTARR